MNFNSLEGKTIIITGASSGIGRSLAHELSKYKVNLVLSARNEEKLKITQEGLNKNDSKILIVTSDISKEEDCKILIEATINSFGGIDVLINNAGISMRAIFEELDLEVIRKVMNTNFWGTVYCTKYALPHLIKSKGSIVGISSIAGKKGLPARTGYSSSKFAMEGFLETIRIENLKKGVHVLIACPGYTTSNIRNVALNQDGNSQGETPLDESKLMSAEEVSIEIIKALIKRKRDLIMTVQGKLTVWLNKFFPSWMDKMVYNHIIKEKNSPLK